MKSTMVDVPRGTDDDNEYPLFLEALKGHFTLEAYLNTARVEGADQGSATGFCLKATATAPENPIRIRVTTPGAQLEYSLDRWD